LLKAENYSRNPRNAKSKRGIGKLDSKVCKNPLANIESYKKTVAGTSKGGEGNFGESKLSNGR